MTTKASTVFLQIFLYAACIFSYANTHASETCCLKITAEDGKPLFSRRLAEKEQFGIRYKHSVALTPVTDFFGIESGMLRLLRTEYQDFGAGLPFSPGPGQKMRFADGKVLMEGYDSKFHAFTLRVGRVADHELLLPAGHSYEILPLNKLATPGAAITFTADCIKE